MYPIQATDDPVEIDPVDVVLVGVKAWQVSEAAQAMRPMVGPETFVVPLLNGVEAPTQLTEVLGTEHVMGGLCGCISFIAGPGHIRRVGADPFIHFGELDNRISQRVESLGRAFAEATGVTVETPPDIQVAMWRKFLMVASWSGIGSIIEAIILMLRDRRNYECRAKKDGSGKIQSTFECYRVCTRRPFR